MSIAYYKNKFMAINVFILNLLEKYAIILIKANYYIRWYYLLGKAE